MDNESLLHDKSPSSSHSSYNSISLNIIPFQQTLNINPIGKPIPNKRGRKPLSVMPSTKKHIQNLANQRAFRLRRENYIKSLESKVSSLEMLNTTAQNEIKNLREKVAMLEKRLASSRSMRNGLRNTNRDSNTRYGGIVGSTVYQAIIEDGQNDECSPYNQLQRQQLNHPKENDLLLSYVTPKRRSGSSHSSSSIESIDDIIQNPLFCDNNKEGNICFGDGGDLDLNHGSKISSQLPTVDSMDKYMYNQKTTSQYSTYPASSQDNEPWQDHPYLAQVPTSITTTVGTSFAQHSPLDLKWILRGEQNLSSN